MQITATDITTARPAFNRAAIMLRAHEIARNGTGRYSLLLKWSLRQAWGEAKRAAVEANMTVAEVRAQHIREEIAMLENKSFRTDIRARRRELETELAALAA